MSSTDTDLPRLLALVEAGYEPEDWGYEPTREVVAALVREVLALRGHLADIVAYSHGCECGRDAAEALLDSTGDIEARRMVQDAMARVEDGR